jgi:DNA-binding MarR family transcriptional regulator
MHTRTAQEALLDVRKSRVDQSILRRLSDKDGLLSGELAKQLELSPNSVTNRLPILEKRGLLVRVKRGKNSLVYLTPKGKRVGKELLGKEVAGNPSAGENQNDVFLDPLGQERFLGQSVSFWN